MTPLSHAHAQTWMRGLSKRWILSSGGSSISAEWLFDNFHQAMSFVNAVAHVANTEDHHPEIDVGYGYCRIRYTTTDVGGLSEHDFICAAKIDAIPRT